MRLFVTDVMQLGLSTHLCVFVLVTQCMLQNTAEDQDAVWLADSRGPKEPCIRWGQDPPREGAIFGVVQPIEKHWESLL